MTPGERLLQIVCGIAIALMGVGLGVFLTVWLIDEWHGRFANRIGDLVAVGAGDVLCLMVACFGLGMMRVRD